MFYRVGVQRWSVLPFFKTYKVVNHEMEVGSGIVRLVLHCLDGTVVAIPGMDRKKVKLYPGHKLVAAASKAPQIEG